MEVKELEELARVSFNKDYAWNFILTRSWELNNNSNSGRCENLGLVRVISRIHGLPVATQQQLLSSLSCRLPLDDQIAIAQCIKHAVAFMSSYSPSPEFWNILTARINTVYTLPVPQEDVHSKKRLLSELVLAALRCLHQNDSKSIEKLGLLDCKSLTEEAKEALKNAFQRHALSVGAQPSSFNSQIATEGHQLDQQEENVDPIVQVSKFFTLPPWNTGKLCRGEAVKAQQISTQRTHEFQSEEADGEALTALNLSNALNNHFKSTAQAGVQKISVPAEVGQSKQASYRSIWRGTGKEVDFLQNSATNGAIISETDQQYLFEKLSAPHWSLSESREAINIKIAQAFYHISKRQRIRGDHFERLVKLLDSSESQYAHKDFRKAIVRMAQNCIARDGSLYFTQSVQKRLNKVMQSQTTKDQEISNLIYDIFLSQENDSKGYASMFKMSLDAVVKNNKLRDTKKLQKLDYVRIQSLDRKRSQELFNSKAMNRLIGILNNSSNPMELRKLAGETIENYLDHGIQPSSLLLEDMKGLSTLSELGESEDGSLQSCVIRIILKKLLSLDKSFEENIPRELWNFLIHQVVSSDNLRLKATILVGLQTLSEVFFIPGADELAPVLISDEFVSGSELCESDNNKEIKIALSSLAAKILLNSRHHLKNKPENSESQLSQMTLDLVIQGIENSRDKQTRIMCSRIVYQEATKTDAICLGEQIFLSRIIELLNDPVVDVKAYCTCVFLMEAYKQSKYEEDPLPCFIFRKAVECFINEKTLYKKLPDFTQDVNSNVVNILESESKKSASIFTSTALNLLDLIVREANSLLEGKVLSIILEYCKSHPSFKLPVGILETLETLLVNNSEYQSLVKDIFELLVIRGQPVPSSYIQILIDSIMELSYGDGAKEYKEQLSLIAKCNLNQELKPVFFSWILKELWNIVFQLGISSGMVKNNKLWGEMKTFLAQGHKLSVESFRIFQTALMNDEDETHQEHKVLSCLLLVAKNGQNIPKEFLKSLSTRLEILWNDKKEIIINLCKRILQNTQMLHQGIRSFFEKQVYAGNLEVLPVILLEIQMHSNLSEHTVEMLCYIHSQDICNVELLTGLVSATTKHFQFSLLIISDLKRCLLKSALAATGELQVQTLAIDGISNLTYSSHFHMDDDETNAVLELMMTKSIFNRNSYETLRLFINNKELSFIQRQMREFLEVTEIKEGEEFLRRLIQLMENYQTQKSIQLSTKIVDRLRSIMMNSRDKVTLKNIIRLLSNCFSDLSQSDLMNCMENVAFILVSNRFAEINKLFQEFMIVSMSALINQKMHIPEKVLHTLQSNLEVTTELLLLVADDEYKYEFNKETHLALNLKMLETDTNDIKIIEARLEAISALMAQGVPFPCRSVQRILNTKCKSKAFTVVLARVVFSCPEAIQLDKELAKLLLKSFTSHKGPDCLMLQAIKKLLQFNGSLFSECKLQALEKSFIEQYKTENISLQLQVSFVECFHYMIPLYEVSKQVTKLLEQNLSHESPLMRHSAFKSLLLLSKVSEKKNEKLREFCERIKHHVDLVCDKKIVWTSQEDSLIETLSSLETWDLNVIKENQVYPDKWKYGFLLSNLISSFMENPLDKQDFLIISRRLRDQLNDESLACEFLEVATSLFRAGNHAKDVLYFCSCLEVVILTESKCTIRNTLEVSRDTQSTDYIKRQAVEIIIRNKCPLNTSIQKWLAGEAIDKLGFNLSYQFVSAVKAINDLDSFEKLISYGQDLEKEVKLNLLPNSISMEDLIEHVERLAVTTLVWRLNIHQYSKRIVLLAPDLTKLFPYSLIKKLLLLLEIEIPTKSKKVKEFETVFEMILHYQIEPEQLKQIVKVLECPKNSKEEDSCSSWVSAANEMIISWQTKRCILKTPFEVVNELLSNLKEVKEIRKYFGYSNSQLESDLNKVRQGDFLSRFSELTPHGNICHWKSKEINQWAGIIKAQFKARKLWMSYDLSIELLAVSKRAFQICSNFHLTNVQTVSLLLGLNKGLRGQLQQVATGSGKSTIVAILAAVNALRCGSADIYTSSPVLAERDAKSWSKFYSLFGLTCSHNGDVVSKKIPRDSSYTRGLKQCYLADVVYGETSMFQFDYLRHHYSNLGTLGARRNDFAIVDEADSMLVDDLSKLARLSSLLPGMDLIQILYHVTWQRLSFIESKLFSLKPDLIYFIQGKISYDETTLEVSLEFSDSDSNGTIKKISNLVGYILEGNDLEAAGIIPIDNLVDFVKDHLTNFLKAFTGIDQSIPPEGFGIPEEARVRIPRNLQLWVETQIPKWVQSCITAKGYEENIHYLVEDGQIKPVDYKCTGIVQNSTSWGGGLHQFLQIKHGLKMTSESVTTNFISNMAMFQKYSKNYREIEELDEDGPEELKKLAKKGLEVKFHEVNIIGLTGTLGSSHTRKLLKEVYNVNCLNLPHAHHKRYVQYEDKLVTTGRDNWLQEICHATSFEIRRERGVLIICETIKDAEEIKERLKGLARTKLYTKNNAGQEGEIKRIQPGEVFIATNLAGRGTDIKTDEIEKYGGLHVILSFLALNVRVEEQAFGRTARQGRLGTGQLICCVNSSPGDNHESNCCGKRLREQRDAEQERQLHEFMEIELPLLKAKDKCFFGFCNFLNFSREYLRTVGRDKSLPWWKFRKFLGRVSSSEAKDSRPTTVELNVLEAIEERWAMFLGIQLEGKRIDLRQSWAYYKFFEFRLKVDLRKGLDRIIRSPFYHISIGNDFLVKDSENSNFISEAMECFEQAVEFDSEFATAAHVGRGFCALRGIRNVLQSDKHEANCKTKAIASFEQALAQIQMEIAKITASCSLVQATSGMECQLFHQLNSKLSVLKNYSNCIEKACQVAKSSLRGINVTAMKTCSSSNNKAHKETRFVPYLSKSFDYSDDTIESTSEVVRVLEAKKFDSFSLEFNDLTMSHDSGEVDQATKTIDNCESLCSSVEIRCKESSGLGNLLPLISPDRFGYQLVKPAALQMLEFWKSGTRWIPSSKISMEVYSQSKDGSKTLLKKYVENQNLKEAIAYVEEYLENSDVLNLRYESGNSKIYNTFRDTHMQLQLIEMTTPLVLKTLKLIADSATTVSLNLRSSKMECLLENISNLLQSTSRRLNVTLLQMDLPEQGSGWKSTTVPTKEIQFQRSQWEKGEAILEDLPISAAKLIIEKCCGEKDFITLSIFNVNRERGFFSSESEMREHKELFSKFKVSFKNVQKVNYREVISCLRNKFPQLAFSVKLNKLSFQNALEALQSAECAQESVRESKQSFISDAFSSEWFPATELWEFQLRGIHVLCEFNEKPPVPWFSCGFVLSLSALQLAIGGLLICTGFGASVGLGFTAEGAADIFTAYRASSTRQFSWNSYATQKAVSLAIAAVSAGIGQLKATGLKSVATRKHSAVVASALMSQNNSNTGAAISVTHSNLRTLALKQVGVSVGEAAGREVLINLTSMGSQLVMSNYKPDVVKCVESKVRGQFYTNKGLLKYLTFLWALDKISLGVCNNNKAGRISLDSKIKGAVQESLKCGSFQSVWNSVGYPLVQGVLASTQQVGGWGSIGVRLFGILTGMYEITYAIQKVIEAIVLKFEMENGTNVTQILVQRLKMPLRDAQLASQQVSVEILTTEESSVFYFKVTQNCSSEEVAQFFSKLNCKQGEFEMECMGLTIKWIGDKLSDHILKIADSQLRGPVTTFMASKTVASISKLVQSNFIVSSKHNSKDINRTSQCSTVADQIHAQSSKHFVVRYKQKQIARRIAKDETREGNNDNSPVPNEVIEKAKKTLNGAPANISDLSALAKSLGKELKIILMNTGTCSVVSTYERTRGGDPFGNQVIILLTPCTNEAEEEIGQYSLVDSSSGNVVPIESSRMDTGYAIFAHLNPGTNPGEMRLEAAAYMLDHAGDFNDIIQNEKWVSKRFPQDAKQFLLLGGIVPQDDGKKSRKISRKNETAAKFLLKSSENPCR